MPYVMWDKPKTVEAGSLDRCKPTAPVFVGMTWVFIDGVLDTTALYGLSASSILWLGLHRIIVVARQVPHRRSVRINQFSNRGRAICDVIDERSFKDTRRRAPIANRTPSMPSCRYNNLADSYRALPRTWDMRFGHAKSCIDSYSLMLGRQRTAAPACAWTLPFARSRQCTSSQAGRFSKRMPLYPPCQPTVRRYTSSRSAIP